MTTLTKPIRRELVLPGDTRPTIIGIDPETKMFTFRAKGCRRVYSYPILAVRIGAVIEGKKQEK
jgi:hypothetical protein